MKATLYCGNRNYSSWSIRASLAVRQSGLECDEVVIPLDVAETAERIGAVSPSGRVPVLHVDGLVIWDSLAIAEYLHERFPRAGIWPQEPGARALARSVSAEMHSSFASLRSEMPMDMRSRIPKAATADVRDDIARIESIWSTCRTAYGRDGDYLFGAWSAADAMYAPVVSRFRTYGVPLAAENQRYADAVWRWPALQGLAAEAAAEPWTI